jgi:hypothetical protein
VGWGRPCREPPESRAAAEELPGTLLGVARRDKRVTFALILFVSSSFRAARFGEWHAFGDRNA